MKVLIGINGPIGCGKSWLANRIKMELDRLDPVVPSMIFGIKDVIWAEFKAERGITVDYDTFKQRVGAREDLIDYAESRRKQVFDYWDTAYTNHLLAVNFADVTVVLNDSVRFQTEWDNVSMTRVFRRFLINIGQPASHVPGIRFVGDSGRRVGNPYISAFSSSEALAEARLYLIPYLAQYARK